MHKPYLCMVKLAHLAVFEMCVQAAKTVVVCPFSTLKSDTEASKHSQVGQMMISDSSVCRHPDDVCYLVSGWCTQSGCEGNSCDVSHMHCPVTFLPIKLVG
jgi:hypothetical protein